MSPSATPYPSKRNVFHVCLSLTDNNSLPKRYWDIPLRCDFHWNIHETDIKT